MDDSLDGLKQLKGELGKYTDGFMPSIDCFSEAGTVADVVNDIVAKKKIDMVVMGTHGSSGLSSFLLGNHSRVMIDSLTVPLLLVPATASNVPIKKICFRYRF